jgi:hypothetical protein
MVGKGANSRGRIIEGMLKVTKDLRDYVLSETRDQQELKQILNEGDVEAEEMLYDEHNQVVHRKGTSNSG